jgi:hypothetical protein
MMKQMNEEYDSKLDNLGEQIVENIVDFDGRELKGFRTTIQSDVRNMLVDSNKGLNLNNQPKLTIIMVLNIHTEDPCNSCQEALDAVLEWKENHDGFEGGLRLLAVDASNGFGEQKMWDKLHISFDDVPLALFFDENQSLIDIVQGVMTVEYLDSFWNEHLEE